VERIRAAGHEIGNHYSKNGTTLGHSEARFVEELEQTERAIGLGALRRREEEEKEEKEEKEEEDLTQRTRREEHREHREHRERATTELQHAKESARVPSPNSDGNVGLEIARLTAAKAASGRCTPRGTTQMPAPKTACSSMRFFRPPGGVAWPWQLRLARERGYTCVLGCAYPHDPMRPPVKYIRWLIEKNLVPGTIVILHDGIRDATRSVAALPQILEVVRQRGLRFVSIGELVDSRGEIDVGGK